MSLWDKPLGAAIGGEETVSPRLRVQPLLPLLASSKAPGTLHVGTVLRERYVIEQLLGKGGMGAVYLAREAHLGGHKVAIKELLLRVQDADLYNQAMAQFAREAEILAGLDHPGLARVLDFFEDAGAQYLVMEYIDGVTLEGLMHQRSGALEVGRVVGWMEEICEVLDHLHGHKPPIVFRDLKPSNVMLDSQGKIRLIDFGLAHVLEVRGGGGSTFLKGAGTPGFSPVEQHAESPTDQRADLYALGATMYRLLTRATPPTSMALWIGERALDPPHRLNPEIPSEVEEVILKLLALRKEDRYQTALEARQALRLSMQKPEPTDALHDILGTDELTGLRNRRFFVKRFPEEAARAVEQQRPLCVAAIDVDGFRGINSLYGDATGDQMLVRLALLVEDVLPEGMQPVRYGGDKFLIVMPNTEHLAALEVLRGLTSLIRQRSFEVEDSEEKVSLTVSMGLAAFPEDTDDVWRLLDLANRAVGLARRAGGDRIGVVDEADPLWVDVQDLQRIFPCPQLVGREALLQEVEPLLVPLVGKIKKPRGHLVFEGAAGCGKTRMLAAIAQTTDVRKHAVVRISGKPYLAFQPFGMLVDAIEQAMRQDARMAARLSAALSSSQILEVSRLLPGLARFCLVETSVPLTADERKRTLVKSFVRILTSWAGGKLLVLLVDDLQWSDAGTLEVLTALKEDAQGRQAAVFFAVPPVEHYQESNPLLAEYLQVQQERGGVLVRPLSPLVRSEVRQMVGAILPSLDDDAALIDLIDARSQGVPLAVEEILKHLIQQERIKVESYQVTVRDVESHTVPENLPDLVRDRLQTLELDAAELLAKAAVRGERFTLDQLRALDPSRNEGRIMDVLDRAARRHFVEYEADDPTGLRFTSAAVHEAIYQALPYAARALLHEQAAATVEARRADGSDAELGEMAWHYERAGSLEKAVQHAELLVRGYGKLMPSGTHPLLRSRTAAALDWPREETVPSHLHADVYGISFYVIACVHKHHMYAPNSRMITQMEAAGLQHLTQILDVIPALTFADAGGTPLVNGAVIPVNPHHSRSLEDLVRLLTRRGLTGVAFKRGVTAEEVGAFIRLLRLKDRERAEAGGWQALAEANGLTNIALNEVVYVQVGHKDIVSRSGVVVIKEVLASASDGTASRPDEAPAGSPARLSELHDKLEKVSGLLEQLSRGGKREERTGGDAEAIFSDIAADVVKPPSIEGLHQELKTIVKAVRPLPDDVQEICQDPEVLCSQLETGDEHQLARAMASLLELGEAAEAPMFSLLIRTSDPRARKAALRILEKRLGPAALCDKIIQAVYHTEYREQTINLLRALGHYHYPEAVRAIGTFIYHSDRETRRAAIHIFERMDSFVLRLELMRALKSRDSRFVRADAAVSLGRVGAREAVPDMVKIIKHHHILRAEEDMWVQKQVCHALGLIGDGRAIPALIKVLRARHVPFVFHRKHDQVREAAAMALGCFHRHEVVHALRRATHDHSVSVRAAAKVALRRIQGDPIEDAH